MTSRTELTALMQTLCAVDGVSGYEDRARAAVREMVAPHADEMTTDAMGSLIVFKKGAERPARRLMICAHTDEVGGLVFRITDEGLLKFVAVGSLDPRVILGQRVRIGEKNLPGVVGVKAFQLWDEKKKTLCPSIEELFVDIGARDRAEALRHVHVGDPIAFESEPCPFGEDYFKAKAIDDRLGCAVMVALIREELPFDAWFAFSVCEEVGLRGAAALTERVRPDVSLVLEGTSAADMPGVPSDNRPTYQRGGAAVSLMDRATFYDRDVLRRMTEAADAEGIRWQPRDGAKGGTDSGSIHLRNGGSLTFGVSAPTRYIHSANNVLYLPDAVAVLDLTRLFIRIMGK